VNGGRITAVLVLVVAGVVPGLTAAQQSGPSGMTRMPAVQASAAVPDTVDIVITVPDSLPQPVAVHVVQDTLEFGGLLNLVLDYAPDQPDGPQLQPRAEGDWLVPCSVPHPGFLARLFGSDSMPSVDLSALPATDGLRVVRSFRVYRRDPLRIRWHNQVSPVLIVAGRTVGANEMATIRDPRGLHWTPWRLILAAVVLLGLAVLARWLWLRRHTLTPLADWPVPVPPWLGFAVGLQELLTDNILGRGDSRLFLDRLALLARSYVAGRYRVAAREMTGHEITRACLNLGYEVAHPAGFSRLIDLADRERYKQGAPEPSFCREQAAELLERVQRVRLGTEYVTIPPEQLLAAQKAWAALTAEFGLGAGRTGTRSGGEMR